MTFDWQENPDDVFGQMVDNFVEQVEGVIRDLLLSYVPRIEAWLKENAPWADRTGNLRQSLHAELLIFANDLALKMDYGLGYGVFLELANAGKYSIMAPAVDHFAPLIFRDLQAILGG